MLEVVLIVGLSFLLALQSPARVIQGPSEVRLSGKDSDQIVLLYKFKFTCYGT